MSAGLGQGNAYVDTRHLDQCRWYCCCQSLPTPPPSLNNTVWMFGTICFAYTVRNRERVRATQFGCCLCGVLYPFIVVFVCQLLSRACECVCVRALCTKCDTNGTYHIPISFGTVLSPFGIFVQISQ